MNTKNIIICLLVTLISFACSKDDSKPDTGSNGKARVAMKLQIRGNVAAVKAGGDPNALPGETDINSLVTFVFNENGTQLVQQVSQEGGLDINLDVPSGERFKLLTIANAPESLMSAPASLDKLQERLATLTSQSQDNLTFSTPVISTTELLTEESVNYIGYVGETNIDGLDEPILLTRIAARVEVNSIRTSFRGTSLEGYTVRIDHLTLANVNVQSHLYSVADWGAVEAEGNMVYGAGATDIANQFASGSQPVDYLGKDFNQIVSDANPVTSPMLDMYTFENSSSATPTLLVIKATLVEENITKYFAVPINEDGIKNNKADHDYIKRNYIYRLHITFSETSFTIPTPPETGLEIRVEVESWGHVHQVEEV